MAVLNRIRVALLVFGALALLLGAWAVVRAAVRQSPAERLAATIAVQGYRPTKIAVDGSGDTRSTYWVGPPGADAKQVVTGLNLVWRSDAPTASVLSSGFTPLADGEAIVFDHRCTVQVLRLIPEEFSLAGGVAGFLGLSEIDARAVAERRLDSLAVFVYCS